jgi:hypothetical protein
MCVDQRPDHNFKLIIVNQVPVICKMVDRFQKFCVCAPSLVQIHDLGNSVANMTCGSCPTQGLWSQQATREKSGARIIAGDDERPLELELVGSKGALPKRLFEPNTGAPTKNWKRSSILQDSCHVELIVVRGLF